MREKKREGRNYIIILVLQLLMGHGFWLSGTAASVCALAFVSYRWDK